MVSPASWMATWSPGPMSRLRQRCSEPRLTYAIRRSSRMIGCKRSTGVIRPLRPIRKSTACTTASAWLNGYFQAAAQCGGAACQRCAGGRLPWRSTTPSLAKGRAPRYQCWRQWLAWLKSPIGWLSRRLSAKPRASRRCRRSRIPLGPSGQSQTNRPMLAACSSSRLCRASSPATRPRAPKPPASACTCAGRRQ
ncbi:hypothetical protein D3C71_1563890 [compost metagenome]